MMLVLKKRSDYQLQYAQWQGKKIALVPTMGALHEGHQALIRQARELADIVVVSIFVNPLQFGPQEDLAAYPRPIQQDLDCCQQLGVDVVFAPEAEEMYPAGMGQLTMVVPPSDMTALYCGAFRPGHFTGVATVVLKLFNLIRPDMAIFGEKDAQQLAVIRKMVQDLHLPVQVLAHPTLRNQQGLALSSRNQYLKSAGEQQAALLLYRILTEVRQAYQTATSPLPTQPTLDAACERVLSQWLDGSVRFEIQYLALVDAQTFQPVDHLIAGTRLLIAAYVNQVRLIDNLALD
ncbi:pantoate--beta-alanine ligase [Vampirovibrio sp.]|uniref:pantoate--beta-alanine ligase n=1 Tax=Vampirovibrio sp. TaxID=2717857 RepID=UPI0035932CD9